MLISCKYVVELPHAHVDVEQLKYRRLTAILAHAAAA